MFGEDDLSPEENAVAEKAARKLAEINERQDVNHSRLERLKGEAAELKGRIGAGERSAGTLQRATDTQKAMERTLTEIAAANAESDGVQVELRAEVAALGGSGTGQKAGWLPGIREYKALSQKAVGTIAGAFIPVATSQTFYDQLRTRVAVLAAGPTVLPVPHAGSVKVPRVVSSVTVGNYVEGAAIVPSDPGLSDITLDPVKLAALTLINREALEDSAPQLRDVVANALVSDLAVELDKQFLVGTGANPQMRGLLNQVGTTAGPAPAANGSPVTLGLVADMLGAAEAANVVDTGRLGFVMHSRTWAGLRKLADADGRPLLISDPTLGVKPSLYGVPVYLSNNVPINGTQGTSSSASSIILADWSQVVVAQARQIELLVSEHYAFANDQLALRVTARFDIGLPQPAAVVIARGIIG